MPRKSRARDRDATEENPPVSSAGFDLSTGTRAHGMVIGVMPRHASVLVGDNVRVCMLPPRLHGNAVAVGDRVEVVLHPSEGLVDVVAPRAGVLSRPDPHDANTERVIAANVDRVVLVVSVVSPPLRERLIDRYLVAVARGGAAFTVCVNKIDLLDSLDAHAELERALAPYRAAGAEVVTCSTHTGAGIDALAEVVRGRTCVFAGHSGVGKSSIVNALVPNAKAVTGEISDAHGKGKHTTTRATVYWMEDRTCLIDTPGVRAFGLWGVEAGQLGWYFPDFVEHAQRCKFRDCTHIHEPKCGVRDAVERGDLMPARYDTYVRILDSLRSGGRD